MNNTKLILVSLFTVLTIGVFGQTTPQQYIAPQPPMGWNSWNFFGPNISEKKVMQMADAMAEKGYKDAGYQYLVIDDGWVYGSNLKGAEKQKAGRDSEGKIIVDAVKFPSGMKKLADYVHSKGLKFGIYTAPGVCTCQEFAGSLGYETNDLKTYAEWGVDYIKLDKCGAKEAPEVILTRWRQKIDSIGRPIVLSANLSKNFDIIRKYAEMWRTTTDILPIWRFKQETLRNQDDIFAIINQQAGLDKYQGNGRWNDPDMLQVGNAFTLSSKNKDIEPLGGKERQIKLPISYEENKAHFGMWAIFSAPLMLGNDLANTTDSVRNILTNPEVIAIDQDPAGIMGVKCKEDFPGLQVWAKPLWKIGDVAVAFLNATDEQKEISIKLSDIGISGQAYFRDVFARKGLGLFSDKFSAKLVPNSILLVKVSAFEKIKPITPCLNPLKFGTKPVRLEAELSRFYKGRWQSNYKGFSGKGYAIGANKSIFNMNWNVYLEKKGNYKVAVRYLNNLQKDVVYSINGKDIELKSSNAENPEWKTVETVLKLEQGSVNLFLKSSGSDANEVAIDYIEITPE